MSHDLLVQMAYSHTSKDPNIMHLWCSLLKVAACLSVPLWLFLFQENLTAYLMPCLASTCRDFVLKHRLTRSLQSSLFHSF